MKNLLFIPTYRCALQIPRVIKSASQLLDYFDEVIIVDNRSPDETAQVARDSATDSKIRVVINPENVGLGGSHKMVFLYAEKNEFDHVVILHGDDQGNLADFTEVLKLARKEKLNRFVFGARFLSQSQLINYSLVRILGNRFFNLLATLITGRRIHDLGGSGLNLFPVPLLKAHPYLEYSNDLTFHVFLELNAIRLGQSIVFTKITWREEDQVSNVRLVRQTMKLFRILTQYLRVRKGLIKDQLLPFSPRPDGWKYL